MGQKVNPKGFRVGVIRDWDSRWYARKEYSDYLLEDYKIRKYLKNKLLRFRHFPHWKSNVPQDV